MALGRFRALPARGSLLLAAVVFSGVAGCGGGDAFTAAQPPAAGGAAGAGGSGTGGAGATGGASVGTGGASAGTTGATGGAGAGKGGSAGATTGTGGSAGASGATGGKGGSMGGTGGKAGAAGIAGASGTAGASGASGAAGASGSGGAAGCDATETPAAGAIHVTPMGVDATADGTAAKPFGSLQKAFAAHKMVALSVPIVVAPGTYDGPSDVNPTLTGASVTVDGGWTAGFTRDCSPTAGAQTILTATAAGVSSVLIVAAGEILTLQNLTVKTKDAVAPANHDNPGGSLYAIWVRNDSTAILSHVSVLTGKGGMGGPPSGPKAGAKAMCDGLNDCSTGEAGVDGSSGMPATAGTFTDNGYTTGDGTQGVTGTPGKNGSSGQTGDSGPCVACTGDVVMCNASTDLMTAASGTCGCGAQPGGPAQPGHGGGASVGVLVATGATLSVVASSVTTSFGGDGSSGGDQGLPSDPTSGAMGSGTACEEKNGGSAQCIWSVAELKCVPVNVTDVQLAGGNAGGKGGTAGKGGKSGGGSGGPSIAIVHSTTAKITVDGASMLTSGPGGMGAPGAPSGSSAAQATY